MKIRNSLGIADRDVEDGDPAIELFCLTLWVSAAQILGTGSMATICTFGLIVAAKTVYIPQLAPTSMKQRACRI